MRLSKLKNNEFCLALFSYYGKITVRKEMIVMNKAEVIRRLRKDPALMTENFDIKMDQEFYTEEQYKNLKETLQLLQETKVMRVS